MTPGELERLFTYHAPTDAEKAQMERINRAAKELAWAIYECTPECADQSAAIRKVREARMTANAAIVCNRPGAAQ
jgi:hypothetical protein